MHEFLFLSNFLYLKSEAGSGKLFKLKDGRAITLLKGEESPDSSTSEGRAARSDAKALVSPESWSKVSGERSSN